MTARTWTLVVRDAHRRPHSGVVTIASAPPEKVRRRGAEYRIVLLTRPAAVSIIPEATAICIPSSPVSRAMAARLPEALDRWRLPAAENALYRSGRIVTAGGVAPPPDAVFPARTGRPRLERIARVLVDLAYAESAAAYAAVTRHELGLEPGADALAGLRTRLMPARTSDRPPPRAPAVARLRRVMRELVARSLPTVPLEQFADDLRFLRIFDADARWTPAAAGRLLRDLERDAEAPATSGRGGARARSLRVVRAGDGR